MENPKIIGTGSFLCPPLYWIFRIPAVTNLFYGYYTFLCIFCQAPSWPVSGVRSLTKDMLLCTCLLLQSLDSQARIRMIAVWGQ